MNTKDFYQLLKNMIESRKRGIAGLTEEIDRLDEQRDEIWRKTQRLRTLRENLQSYVAQLEAELSANPDA